ncbi:hypothetical protein [Pedococcus soli]
MSGLVATPGERSWHSGAGLLDSGMTLCESINGDSWVDQALSAGAVGVDVYATVSDPLGSLFAAGIGWVIDHLNPIKDWFDELTGNPEEVAAFSETWSNVRNELDRIKADYARHAEAQMGHMQGEALESYRKHVKDMTDKYGLVSNGAHAISYGFVGAAGLVQLVHGLVRDALAQIVGALCSYVAELVITLGAATPLVIHQATSRVSALVAEIGPKLKGLKSSVHSLDELTSGLKDILNDIPRFLGDRYSVPNHPELKWDDIPSRNLKWAERIKAMPGGEGLTLGERIRLINMQDEYKHLLGTGQDAWEGLVKEALASSAPNNVNDAIRRIRELAGNL